MHDSRGTVLLIDEDSHLLRTLSDRLCFDGISVATANSCDEGMQSITIHPPALILLDMHAPGANELRFLARLHEDQNFSSIPVLVLASAPEGRLAASNQPNVVGVLAKSVVEWRLLMAIRWELGRRLTATGPKPGAQIMLAEDDEVFAGELTALLEQAGHSVEVVRTGMELLGRTDIAKHDAIVLKETLPRLSGTCLATLADVMPSMRSLPILIYHNGQPPENAQVTHTTGAAIRLTVVCAQPTDVARAFHELLAAAGPRTKPWQTDDVWCPPE